MESVELQTSRLILRAITPSLIHDLFETKTENEIKAFFGADQKGFERLEEMHKKGMETHKFLLYYFLMVEKATSNIIGECGFHSWNRTHQRAELFYALKNDEDKRKGFTSEALVVVLEFGFTKLQIHRVEALTVNWNEASVAVLRKFGFTKEGLRRKDYFLNGKYEDSESYSLLAQEWKSQREKL